MAEEKKKPVCIRCGHTGHENDQYCIRCAAPLINRCSDAKGLVDKGCAKENRVDAAYCAYCGKPTIFQQESLLAGHPAVSPGKW